MLAGPADWKGKSRRAFLALLLTVLSGVTTASYAGYRLGTAWEAVSRCNPPPPGSVCSNYQPFWGLPPTWFLGASFAGLTIGLLTAVIGWELHRRAFGVSRGVFAILVLSAAGLVAYGGLGIGTGAGIAGGLLFATFRPRRTPPAEWSGTLPPGVPPVKSPPRTTVPERPSLSEWEGVALPGSTAPPRVDTAPGGASSEDRLAVALSRAKSTGRAAEGGPSGRQAVVVLPPPPVGHTSAPTLTPAPTRSEPPAKTPAPVGSPPPPKEKPSGEPSAGLPKAPPVAATRPAPPAEHRLRPSVVTRDLPPLPRRSVTGRPQDPVAPSKLRASSPTPPSALPTQEYRAKNPPAPQPGGREESASRPALNEMSPSPSASRPAPPRPASEGGGPVAGAKGRTRAWTCPACQLVNAPWSNACTRCKAPAPGVRPPSGSPP